MPRVFHSCILIVLELLWVLDARLATRECFIRVHGLCLHFCMFWLLAPEAPRECFIHVHRLYLNCCRSWLLAPESPRECFGVGILGPRNLASLCFRVAPSRICLTCCNTSAAHTTTTMENSITTHIFCDNSPSSPGNLTMGSCTNQFSSYSATGLFIWL